MNREEAFTGLEAAIVLIAFVVVAAVFSYVVLGAGFFTTQKSQEVVASGVSQASSSMQILGDVYGLGNGTELGAVQFTLGLTAGGSAIDMEKTTLVWSTSETVETLAFNTSASAGNWAIIEKNNGDDDNLLEDYEQFVIKAMPSNGIGVNTNFKLEIRPSIGATIAIDEKVPPQVDPVMDLTR
ncbi:MAG: flagellin [Methanomicrobiaceae archaeon]|nr:flagellin [Methanomicrobiaceae archaeon]